ncbi:VOC family protein [Aestuariirhabdus sp. LZHN29]|uniref:VOC family protein n=1 Tax=Aestuariirhabdus sp. LZHN29 TaxID=3417462 RepID=UPI003CECD5CE
MSVSMDHLVVAARTVEEGVDYLRQQLGVSLPAGGKHPRMGTHNHLMRVGDGVFLEVIAIDPKAEPPQRPRWFGLDDSAVRRLLDRGPRLHTWVANVPDLSARSSRLGACYGTVEAMTRDALRWDITLPEDGQLPGGGLLPTLLQWHTQGHPSKAMTDLGCCLKQLVLRHNRPDWLRDQLQQIGAEALVAVEGVGDDRSPSLCARFETPAGERWLDSSTT